MPAPNASLHPRILVADDHPGSHSEVAASLRGEGFAITVVTNVAEVDRMLARKTFDLVILNLISPLEELSVCRRLATGEGPAVIIVSTAASETDKVIALEFGANHLISSPFSSRELLAHVRSVLRRRSHLRTSAESAYRFLGWRLDLSTHELNDPAGRFVELTPGELNLLRAFVERPRQVLSREELLDAVHRRDSDSSERMIDVHICRLRRKLKINDIIRTVRNGGYIFVPPVEHG